MQNLHIAANEANSNSTILCPSLEQSKRPQFVRVNAESDLPTPAVSLTSSVLTAEPSSIEKVGPTVGIMMGMTTLAGFITWYAGGNLPFSCGAALAGSTMGKQDFKYFQKEDFPELLKAIKADMAQMNKSEKRAYLAKACLIGTAGGSLGVAAGTIGAGLLTGAAYTAAAMGPFLLGMGICSVGKKACKSTASIGKQGWDSISSSIAGEPGIGGRIAQVMPDTLKVSDTTQQIAGNVAQGVGHLGFNIGMLWYGIPAIIDSAKDVVPELAGPYIAPVVYLTYFGIQAGLNLA